jgi:hypothetical protein
MRSVRSSLLVTVFADRFLTSELPGLPAARRKETVEFTCRRIDTMASVTRFGVFLVAGLHRAMLALPGGTRLSDLIVRLPLPLAGEYPRLLRSLGFAYVWETWPDTCVDGAPSRPRP